MPPDKEVIYNFELENDCIKKIYVIRPVEGHKGTENETLEDIYIAPAKHFVTMAPERKRAVVAIKKELKEQLTKFEKEGKLLEAERLERRTKFDTAMIEEIGYCNGIENYSRHLSGRPAGDPPSTLLDYFPKDFLMIIDESHVTIPQLQGMYAGDASRKKTLIEYGFRLPSAADNRPLTFDEFEKKMTNVIYTSATPGPYEYKKNEKIIEQIIRPTGLIDPKITVHPVKGQIQHVIQEIQKRVNPEKGKIKERVLITTLTKKMAEDLSSYLEDLDIKVSYLHSDVKTLDRIRILTDLRKGTIDVLVGVNLLREGLDLPEVSLVAILDADKEGFLRSETSLIQTIGRAARNANGEVLMYADTITGSIERALKETNRRREIQIAYNKKHGIIPQTILKDITDILPTEKALALELTPVKGNKKKIDAIIKEKEKEMREAAERLDFELATILRNELFALKKEQKQKTKKTS
jgi:excinuclease ABC subunit B